MGRCGNTTQNWFSAIEKGDLSLVRKLWKDISDIDVTDTYILNNIKHENVTGLIIGAHYGYTDVVRWLLKNKANANWETNLKWRPIHFAAKRGHCATVDMLCCSGAVVDPVTMDNETPLSLALQSHMRDTVRKLVRLGAQTSKNNEGLAYHCVYRGMLVSDDSSKTHECMDTNRDKDSQLRGQSLRTNSPSVLPIVSSPYLNDNAEDFSVAVFDSQIIMNQLQCQSTSYDLELARRKRELIRRLPLLPCMSQQSANQFIQMTQRASRADLPIDSRLSAVSHLFNLLPALSPNDNYGDLSNKMVPINAVSEPYLRLIEACLCETHCPLELSVQLSRLAAYMAGLGAGKQNDINGSVAGDDFSPISNTPSAYVISYILKLLRKLVLKGNPQYRSGILAHLSRILSDLCVPTNDKSGRYISSVCSWCDLLPIISSIISNLIRLGESLDQPLNVPRFAQLVGLIARCLVSALPKAGSNYYSSRFSDLADILVGWSVDSSGSSKDVNVDTIYEEIHFGLSYWFLTSTEEKTGELKQVLLSSTINENIREMVSHLLEDSENSLNTAISEYTTLNCKRGPTVSGNAKPALDPNAHFVSVQLFLNALSSIFGGICNYAFASGNICFEDLMSESVSQWIERLLRISQSTSAHYASLLMQKQNASWHSSHAAISTPCVPLIVLDGIQSSIFQLLNCLVQFSDCSSADMLAVNNCAISSVDSGSLIFTNDCLASLLDLVSTILTIKYSSTVAPADPSSLFIYFDSHSKLHHLKLCCKSNGKRTSTPSQKIFKVLCCLSSLKPLQGALCELALSDLRLATGSQQHSDLSLSSNSRRSEILGLFSISLLTIVMQNISYELKNELLYRLAEIIRTHCLKNWDNLSTRLRAVLLSFLNNPSVFKMFQPVCIMDMLTNFLSMKSVSCVEGCILLNLIDSLLSDNVLRYDDQLHLFTHLIALSKRTLVSKVSLDSTQQNVFILCVKLLIKYALPCIKDGNTKLACYLLHLSQLALSYPCLQVQKAGNDLLLLVSSFASTKIEFPAVRLYSELLWFTTRRPDYSSTSLLSVSDPSHSDSDNNSSVDTSTSFPSLPAVAGILGILTRGAPYTQKTEGSRLQILKNPSDWIRRLSCLISPLPSDRKCSLLLLQCTSFVQPVLWHAAWAMVDYKLKVAPWANPLKTLFSLEGTLRAFIQPVYASDPSNGNSSIVSFHVASSEALSHQTTNRQLNQIHLLINFLDYLERIIFNATSGFALALPRPAAPASVFFSANENTCTHWFNRIRNLLVRISSDLPLVCRAGVGPSNEVLSTAVYHAYSLLKIVSDCKDSKDCDTWLKNLKQYGGSTDVLIHLSEALRKLGAWEELKALAQWLDDLFAVERNPFSWLHGICSLTRGHWDKGIEKLNRFLDSNLSKSKIISAENLVTNNVNEFSDQTLSLVYVADVLLQTYISEGDYHSALKLRNRIKSCLKTKTLKQYSAFQLTSARLDCLNKLSEWASTNDVRDNLTTDTSQPWSQNSLRTQLDNLLVNATCSMRKNSDSLHDNSSFMCFSELASIVRQRSASATFLPPLNLFADFYAQSSSVLNGGLLDWLVKAEFLINKQTYASYETSDPINYSSWLHVTPSSSKSHSDAEFSACQWACLNNCPNLAQRLLVRAAKCLTLFDCDISTNKEQKSYFDELCNLALSGSGGIMSKLSQLNTLRFYNYMAKILWLSCDERSQNEHHKKIKAIAILTSGLKLALSENVSCDVIETASQCNLKAEMALTLFEWLESPSNSGNISWAERIHRGFTRSDVSEQKSQRLLCIASDLELFSHLSDVSWCNGTPNITTPFHSTNSSASSSLWTNRLLMMATHLSSNGLSASVWLTMANWCYTRGHKEIHEFQLAARNYIKDINEKSSSHPSVSILLKLVQPKEYTSLTTLVQKLSVSSQENTSDNEGSDLCIPAVISALTTFLASDRCDEDDLELSKHHNTLNTHLHQFSAQCPDDEFDSQIQEKFFSHLHKIIPHLKKSNMTSELTQIVHQLLVSITERQHTLHMSAAQAYATFLTIADQSSVSENPLFSKPICKLDITTTTLKFLDLLCSPSRKLRSMISGFLDQASPVLWEFEQNQCSDEQSIEIKLPSKVKSGSTLGGPAIWEACLPQVLIQLGLPDDMIRNCLVALLNRLIYISTETNVNSKWNSPSYRLAAQLVYPAVVAASNPVAPEIPRSYFKNEGIVSGTVNGRDLESSSNTSVLIPSSKLTPSHSFSQIVVALKKSGLGDLVEQVEIFTYELKRITVLWEELWLGSLVQHLDELSKKINILESELKRTKHLDVYQNTDHLKVLSTCESSVHLAEEKENSILSLNNSIKNDIEAKLSIYNTEGSVLAYKEFPENIVLAKYIATLQPTLDLLSQLIALTVLVKPETPHEEWFQKTFGHAINELQESLSNPTDPRDVKEPVLLIRQLIEQLQTSHQSTSFSQSHAVSRVGTAVVKLSHNNICYLNLRQLSPRLSSMHFENSHIDTSNRLSCGIPLPGHFGVEASHLGSRITVLPTKTRPKRLLLKAQNGRNYPYLLKGLEDLRLDDRIMRLFELTNLAAVQLASNGSGYSESMLARTYSVTPLGVRSGLLQMVQGAVPLFSLYKKWQIRTSNLTPSGTNTYSTAVIPRPGELFHARLKELLHSSGQEYQPQSRSSWPLDILRKVLNSLEEETPADLLTRELWASNPSCASWWRVTRTFAKSAGLLSSLGYLVGLGDRHLDNLLIDLSTGHIVHIDYNVCFDKGKGLRVAERVPFRLTRILRHPLGPGAQDTLVRGTFRFSAENGLQAARHIADAFLIQLKAFLIDPLVDWQNRKHPTNNSQVVTDFIHLSAFHGGGSTNSCCYRSVSTNRRLRRVDSELRMYSGFLTLRLLELSHSACLDSAFSVLDSVVSRLAVWSEFARARQHASFLNDRYSTLQAATQDDLLSSESHCQQVEQVEQKVKELYEELSKQNDLWMNEILSHFQNYKSLTDPSWLPSLLASSVDLNSPLCTALSNYHSVARIYVNNPAFMDSLTLWIEELKQFHSRMSFLVQSPSADIDLLTAFISSDIPQFISHCDLKISNLLQQTTKKGFSHLCEMRRIKAENLNVIPDYVNSDSTILHEINNLNLFVYDQGTAGIAAYCWALLDYVLNVSDNSLALEIEFKEWSMNSSIYQSENDNLKAFPLDQLTTYTDCLVNLFSVLRHQSTGVWSFSAGYEADVIRELAFLVAVRDSVCCVSQLRANLIRLLVPEAMEALIMANVSVMENFSKFVVHQMTKPGESNLRQLVDDFLKDSVVENQDVQLHQVLVAAHLAFTNTTAQMEEISIRIRSCSVTALAWYYVDIVSQVTNVLMSKSSDWSEGATSLWRWESNTTNNTSESVSSCSWADEVYAAGMMTFISILQDRLTHWRAIHYGSVDKIDDLTLKPFTDPINFYIVRLASRISLPSMVGLASSRLFCALVENTGLSIRRLLIESELSIKASGVVGVLSLSAEKMMESVNVQISLTQPISVQHLKTPASNLIHRLVTRSSQVSQCSVDAIELEAAERHYKHLSLSMSAYNWMHLTQTDKELQLYQQDAPSSLAHVLDSIKHSTTLDCASIETLPDISVNSIASSIHCIETLRSNGLLSYSSFYKCINLITELKKAMEYKEKLTSEFNKLDRIICAVKEAYVLDWPILDWLPSTGGNIEAGNKVNLFGRLESDVNSAECALEELRQRLTLLKQEFIEMCLKSDSLNDDDINQSSSPVIISKRPTRSLHHSRITTLPASQPLVSLSLSSSDISVNAKHPALITSLRSHLSTLQKEKLSDIRQLVKLLSRYDVVRSSLLSSNQMSVGEGCCGVSVWSTWLINHQNWTTDVLNVLKSLSKFITSLSDSNKNSLSDDEMEFATSLNQHCLLVKLKMIEELIIPLLNGIDKHITTNPRLYDTLKGFLLMLNVHFKAMGGTVRNQMNELGMETVESRKTQDAEQVTVSEKSLNIMALSVWNRIYDRLHGFDSSLPTADANKPMSISAQIDACIHEATNVDNLALMYEGWTAWLPLQHRLLTARSRRSGGEWIDQVVPLGSLRKSCPFYQFCIHENIISMPIYFDESMFLKTD